MIRWNIMMLQPSCIHLWVILSDCATEQLVQPFSSQSPPCDLRAFAWCLIASLITVIKSFFIPVLPAPCFTKWSSMWQKILCSWKDAQWVVGSRTKSSLLWTRGGWVVRSESRIKQEWNLESFTAPKACEKMLDIMTRYEQHVSKVCHARIAPSPRSSRRFQRHFRDRLF